MINTHFYRSILLTILVCVTVSHQAFAASGSDLGLSAAAAGQSPSVLPTSSPHVSGMQLLGMSVGGLIVHQSWMQKLTLGMKNLFSWCGHGCRTQPVAVVARQAESAAGASSAAVASLPNREGEYKAELAGLRSKNMELVRGLQEVQKESVALSAAAAINLSEEQSRHADTKSAFDNRTCEYEQLKKKLELTQHQHVAEQLEYCKVKAQFDTDNAIWVTLYGALEQKLRMLQELESENKTELERRQTQLISLQEQLEKEKQEHRGADNEWTKLRADLESQIAGHTAVKQSLEAGNEQLRRAMMLYRMESMQHREKVQSVGVLQAERDRLLERLRVHESGGGRGLGQQLGEWVDLQNHLAQLEGEIRVWVDTEASPVLHAKTIAELYEACASAIGEFKKRFNESIVSPEAMITVTKSCSSVSTASAIDSAAAAGVADAKERGRRNALCQTVPKNIVPELMRYNFHLRFPIVSAMLAQAVTQKMLEQQIGAEQKEALLARHTQQDLEKAANTLIEVLYAMELLPVEVKINKSDLGRIVTKESGNIRAAGFSAAYYIIPPCYQGGNRVFEGVLFGCNKQ